MKLVLIGMPGSGKSTQGNLLSSQLGVPYLSTGDVFRQLAKEKSALGRHIKQTIDSGVLIQDDDVITIVKEYLSRDEYKKGYILDGFPRTTKQAEQFGDGVDKVLFLQIPDKEALWRLAFRNDSLRNDDTIATIKKRIEIFHNATKPVINFYESHKKLAVINGAGTIEEVNTEILQNIGKAFINYKLVDRKKSKKTIICLVGLPGSGKTEAANFFRAKSIPVITFGSVVNDYITKNGLQHTVVEHKKTRALFREKYGIEALAVLQKDTIKQALEQNDMVVIDSVRPFEEYQYMEKTFTMTNIVIVALYCSKNDRFARVAKRSERNRLTGEERDLAELNDTNMGPTIAYADYLIDNSGLKSDLLQKLEAVYKKIYFSH